MVVSEAADFLDADLEAGKTYFVAVRPRMGAWRARFSLEPIAPSSGRWSNLTKWLDDSYVVTTNAAGEQWARDNQASVTAKRDKYLRAWLAKDERPALQRADGCRATEHRGSGSIGIIGAVRSALLDSPYRSARRPTRAF